MVQLINITNILPLWQDTLQQVMKKLDGIDENQSLLTQINILIWVLLGLIIIILLAIVYNSFIKKSNAILSQNSQTVMKELKDKVEVINNKIENVSPETELPISKRESSITDENIEIPLEETESSKIKIKLKKTEENKEGKENIEQVVNTSQQESDTIEVELKKVETQLKESNQLNSNLEEKVKEFKESIKQLQKKESESVQLSEQQNAQLEALKIEKNEVEKRLEIKENELNKALEDVKEWENLAVNNEQNANLYTAIQTKYAAFKEKANEVYKHGEEDIQRIENAKKEFQTYKQYILSLLVDFYNKIFEAFLNILEDEEQFHITKGKDILILPIDKRDRGKTTNLQRFKAIEAHLSNIKDTTNYREVLLMIADGTQRRATELDFRLVDANFPKEVLPFLKQQLSGIILQLKKLRTASAKLLQLAEKALKSNDKIEQNLLFLDAEKAMALILETSIVEENLSLDDLLNKEVIYIQHNARVANEALETAKSLKKAYFKYLKIHFFSILTGLQEARKNFDKIVQEEKYTEHRTILNEWGVIYSKLEYIFKSYLEKKLHILPIETKRGDRYNPKIHEAIAVDVDKDLENEQIKEIDTIGFEYELDEIRFTIKAANVIVVKNS